LGKAENLAIPLIKTPLLILVPKAIPNIPDELLSKSFSANFQLRAEIELKLTRRDPAEILPLIVLKLPKVTISPTLSEALVGSSYSI